MDTFQQQLNIEPAAPQRLPTRWPIAFACLVPALPRNRAPEGAQRQRFHRHVGQLRHHPYQVAGQRVRRQPFWLQARQLAQLEQPHGDQRQKAQQPQQPRIGLEVALLQTAARFQALMIVFHQPATGVPLCPLPGRRHRQRGHAG